jgi:hypothetical protein
MHFIRYLYLALFETRGTFNIWEDGKFYDLTYLLFIISPAFVIGLRFWTAPVYLNYRRQINAAVVPFCVPVVFLASHWDILILALLVIFMNIYVFWYHVDPPAGTTRAKTLDFSARIKEIGK